MNKIPMKLCETFSGIGMQRRGIENSNLFDVENVATSEIDANAIISYAAIHEGLTNDMVDNYSDYPSREEMAQDLLDMNINYDFKEKKPYDWFKIAGRKDSKKQLQKTWLACKLSKNYGDISKVETFPHCGLLTFSFPCQDLSVAGKSKGIVKGKTRSGQVYEILRILKNMKAINDAPRFLLMENVDALLNSEHKPQFEKLNEEFKELGYDVKYRVMNGKYCGVPQNRNRVFAIYSLSPSDLEEFEFPKEFDNGIRLEDIIFDHVDEKYFINNEKATQMIKDLEAEGKLDDYK